jgi:hypothetical protein
MSYIGNAQSFRVEGNVPGNLTVSGTSLTVNGNEALVVDKANQPLDISSSAGNGSITVDSSGRVFNPNQPSFLAYKASTAQSISALSWTVVEFDTTASPGWNIGSHYNTTNDRFTAPVDGIYFLAYNVQFSTAIGNGYTYVGMRLNAGNVWFYGDGRNINSQNSDNTLGMGTLVRMSTNDYIQVYAYSGVNNSLGAGDTRCQFNGYLVSSL